MVSRANVPRKMTSATRLTEAEKIELEWESLWERIGASSEWESLWERIGASCCKIQREQEAKFDELKKAILDLSLPSEGRSMATTDANSGSYCSTDFKQLECNLSPVQKTEELELPHVEGPRSYNLESHESGWDVQRSTAATNEHSDSFESHVREGEVRLDPSEFMPLLHNLKPTKVNNINYESYFLNFSHNSMTKPSKIVDYGLIEQHIGVMEDALSFTGKELGNCWKCSLHSYVDAKDVERLDHEVKGVDLKLEQYIADFSEYKTFSQANKLKKVECLQSVRKIATVRDLAVTLNVVTNLRRLPVRYPKPLVKMKFMVVPVDSCRVFKGGGMTRVTHMQIQYDEVIGGNLGKQIDLGVGSAAMWQLEIFQYRDENLNKTIVHFYVHFGQRIGRLFTGSVDGQFGTPQVQDMPICFDVGRLSMVTGGLITDEGAVVFGSVDDRKEQGLSLEFICPTYRNCDERSADLKFCISWKKAVSDEISAGVLMVCQGIDGKYVEMDAKATALELLEVYIDEEDINDVVYLLKKLKLFSGIDLNYIDLDGNEGEEEKVLAENGTVNGEHVDKNLNLFGNAVPNDLEVFNLGGVEGFNTWDNNLKFDLHYVPSLLNISLQALDVCAGGIVSLKQVPENIHQTIGRCEMEKLQAGVRYAMENPSYYEHSNIAGLVYLLEIHKVAKPQPSIVWDSISSMNGLNTKVLFSERNGTDQPTTLYDAAKRAGYGLWGKLEMAYFFFTSDILKGNSIPIFEAATYETAAVGKSTGCSGKKRIHQLTDIGWMVSVLFPKPRVKMKVWEDKHEKLGSMIPCGQGIIRGMECCKHKLSYAEVVKERFPWFLEDKEP